MNHHHHRPEGNQPTMAFTISIGYTRSLRCTGFRRDYIPSMDGYRPGAAQDVVTIVLPEGTTPLSDLTVQEVAEAVFVATNGAATSHHEAVGAYGVGRALVSLKGNASRQARALSVGDTVTAHGHTVACLPVGFAEVPGYQPPGHTTAHTPEQVDFLTHVITTAVEGGINYWAHVSGYHWYFPDLDGGTARPGPGGSANAYVTVHEDDTEGQGRCFIIGVDGIAHALRRITAGPVEHMSEQRRELIRRAYGGNEDACTAFDAFDAEEVVQVACFGKVVYG